ncbi:hypothetical protein WA158_001147 [Blastocystis sp. Blastoise]
MDDCEASFARRFVNIKVFQYGKIYAKDILVVNGKMVDCQMNMQHMNSTIQNMDDYKVIDGQGAIVIPGFILTNLPGAFGINFSDSDISTDDIEFVVLNLVKFGITSFCASITPVNYLHQCHLLDIFKTFIKKNKNKNGSILLGIHLNSPILPQLLSSSISSLASKRTEKLLTKSSPTTHKYQPKTKSIQVSLKLDKVKDKHNNQSKQELLGDKKSIPVKKEPSFHLNSASSESSESINSIPLPICLHNSACSLPISDYLNSTLKDYIDILKIITINSSCVYTKELIQWCKQNDICISFFHDGLYSPEILSNILSLGFQGIEHSYMYSQSISSLNSQTCNNNNMFKTAKNSNNNSTIKTNNSNNNSTIETNNNNNSNNKATNNNNSTIETNNNNNPTIKATNNNNSTIETNNNNNPTISSATNPYVEPTTTNNNNPPNITSNNKNTPTITSTSTTTNNNPPTITNNHMNNYTTKNSVFSSYCPTQNPVIHIQNCDTTSDTSKNAISSNQSKPVANVTTSINNTVNSKNNNNSLYTTSSNKTNINECQEEKHNKNKSVNSSMPCSQTTTISTNPTSLHSNISTSHSSTANKKSRNYSNSTQTLSSSQTSTTSSSTSNTSLYSNILVSLYQYLIQSIPLLLQSNSNPYINEQMNLPLSSSSTSSSSISITKQPSFPYYYTLTSDPLYAFPYMLQIPAQTYAYNCILEPMNSIYMGLDDGIITYQDKEIMIDNGYIYDINNKKQLQGSTAPMTTVIHNFLADTSLPLEYAVFASSVNPAKYLNIYNHKGSLEHGMDADILFLDSNFNVLYTYIQGKPVFDYNNLPT